MSEDTTILSKNKKSMKNNWHSARKVSASVVVFAFLLGAFGFGFDSPKAQQNRVSNLLQKYAKADAVTSAIRNQTSEILRVQINSLADREKAGKLGRVVEDYGSFIILAKHPNADSSALESQKIDTTINLPSGKFEPLGNAQIESVAANSASISEEKNYYIVQLGGIAKDEWLESLRAAGGEIIQYIPHQAFLVYANGEAISQITNHSRVRWVGPYQPEFKLSPVFRQQVDNARGLNPISEKITPIKPTAGNKGVFEVAVFSRADLAEVAREIQSRFSCEIKSVSKLPHNYFNFITVEIELDRAAEIARMKDVVSIEAYIEPQVEDERAAQIVAGNFISQTQIAPPGYNPLTQFGVNGNNVTIAVTDDGVSATGNGGFYITESKMINMLNGAAVGPTAGSGHGHSVATMAAGDTPFSTALDPLGFVYAMGVAPKANIINIPLLKSGYIGGFQGGRVQAVNDTVMTLGPNGVRGTISNNSWGDGTNGNSYDSQAAQYDGFACRES